MATAEFQERGGREKCEGQVEVVGRMWHGAGVERHQWSFTDMKVGKKAGEQPFFKWTHGV